MVGKSENQENMLVGGECSCSKQEGACCSECNSKSINPFDFDAMDSELDNLVYKAFKTGVITATVIGAVAFLAYKGVKRKRKTRAVRFTVKH